MTKRERARIRRQRTIRRVVLTASLMVLVAVCAIGGTVAWLTADTKPVVNTFTAGDINITLTETTTDFKMVPGNTIDKDPVVTVKGGSEACWLFVKVEESTAPKPKLTDYIEYSVDSEWKKLGDAYPGVYYRKVAASESDQEFSVLTNNKVSVKDTVTKPMMEAIEGDADKPTLTFTAYACQSDNVSSAEEAWAKLTTTT